ncbi:hypothetical protein SLEP1_g6220 [Rubroshorea leprosula]|uniref:Uncharacterized protein n=1 Tax=Rubroshorea leprosula TaxID=152421 RepID=A0AAV5I2N2_9ROSI|nr:hypothetical protein SLEP1_g6220 [Rubroshorea leprosula]
MPMVAPRRELIAFGFDPEENNLAFNHGDLRGNKCGNGEGRDENKKMVAFERSEAVVVLEWRIWENLVRWEEDGEE